MLVRKLQSPQRARILEEDFIFAGVTYARRGDVILDNVGGDGSIVLSMDEFTSQYEILEERGNK